MTDQTHDAQAEQILLERMQDLLQRGALFRFLAQGFSYPHPGHPEAVRQTMEAMQSVSLVQPDTWSMFREQWDLMDLSALQAEHCRLFQGRNVVSLHETSYGDARRIGGQVVELSDINGFYRAFGMQVSAENPDMPDHLCTELEFYSLLLVKQSFALDNDWQEEEAVTADASRKFMEYHLGRWIAPMLFGLREHGLQSVYVTLGELLEQVITTECRLQEITPQPFSGPVPTDEITADIFTCPMSNKKDPAL
ncbi:MAG: molecular chaperone TorD family protein [Magnetococcus sp. YQC-5]